MPCYYPLQAFRDRRSGEVMFREKSGSDCESMELSCGRCIGCRLERSRKWALRCMHEAAMHKENVALLLTYDDAHLPSDGSLCYRHFQLFMKRLRRVRRGVRFYMCGEYGESSLRPHYHVLLFGCDFPDKVFHKVTGAGSRIYTSAVLDSLWGMGHCGIGELNFESAAYAARYALKKYSTPGDDDLYMRVDVTSGAVTFVSKEFSHMSLKPGIGVSFLSKYSSDVFPSAECYARGVMSNAPRYYVEKWWRKDNPELIDLKERRAFDNYGKRADNTRARLATKEVVQRSRINFLRRSV